MVDIHVHILIGDHFIEITLACVIGEEERWCYRTGFQPSGMFSRGELVSGRFWCWF